MKRVIILVATVFLAVCFFSSCEKKKNDADAIIGHSYKRTDDAGWEIFYFSPSGSAQLTSCKNGANSTYNNLDYTIDGCNVEVHYDYSNFWKETSRGQLLAAFTYLPESESLMSSFGDLFVKIY